MKLFYDIDRSSYEYSSSTNTFLEILKTFLDYQPDSNIFKSLMDTLYSLCDVSFSDFIIPMIQNYDLINVLVSILRTIPPSSPKILKFFKMVMIEDDKYAEEIINAIGFDFLEELLDLKYDQSKLLQKDVSALIYNFLKTNFDEREYEDLGPWFLEVFMNHLQEFSQDSMEYLMDSIPLFQQIYKPKKWSDMVNKSHIIEWMWSCFNQDSLILTTDQLLYVLSNIIKFSNNEDIFPIDFGLLGSLAQSEDNKTKIATYDFLRRTFITSKKIHDFIYTEDFLHIFFTDLNEAPFNVKKAAINLLYCLMYEANGSDALEIGNYGLFALLIPHLELYSFRLQLKILHIFDRLLFWGQRRGDHNHFIDQFNECDGFDQLINIMDQPSTHPKIREQIDKIMTEYFDPNKGGEEEKGEDIEIDQNSEENPIDFYDDDSESSYSDYY